MKSDTQQATWDAPLLTLAPLAAIAVFSDRASTLWVPFSWVLWGLSAVLMSIEWARAFRHGTRTCAQWPLAALAHAVLAWQLIDLLR